MKNPKINSILTICGYLLLLLFVVFWGITILQGELLWGKHTWITYPVLGADFWTQVDLGARLYHQGIDPYASKEHLLHYPPLAFRLFAWTPFLGLLTSHRIWTGLLILMVVAGVWGSYRTRQGLCLERIPFVFILGITLFSFPVIFSIERGNYDLMVVAIIVVALRIIRSRRRFSDFWAGCLLAIAPWAKLYPGLMGLGFLTLRWWRVISGFVFMGIAIGLLDIKDNIKFYDNMKLQLSRMDILANITKPDYFPWTHSLPMAWFDLMKSLGMHSLQRLPGGLIAAVILVPLLVWVCVRVYRCPEPEKLVYPLLLWLNALATFYPLIANDYNLVYLPICIIAVYRITDPWYIQAGLASFLLWWQPFTLPINSYLFLAIKFIGLVMAGWCIVKRAEEMQLPQKTSNVGATANALVE
jgi:hypothetical protein